GAPAGGGAPRYRPPRRAAADRLHRLPRAQLALGGRAGARGPLDGPVGRARVAAVHATGPRPPAGPQRGRGLLLLLGRPKPLLVLGEPDAGTDAGGARAGAARRD